MADAPQGDVLDMVPLALFRLIRAFHERTLPRAGKVRRWPAIVAVFLVVLIMLLVGTVVSSR